LVPVSILFTSFLLIMNVKYLAKYQRYAVCIFIFHDDKQVICESGHRTAAASVHIKLGRKGILQHIFDGVPIRFISHMDKIFYGFIHRQINRPFYPRAQIDKKPDHTIFVNGDGHVAAVGFQIIFSKMLLQQLCQAVKWLSCNGSSVT